MHFGRVEGLKVYEIWVQDSAFAAYGVIWEDERVVFLGSFSQNLGSCILPLVFLISSTYRRLYLLHFESPGSVLFRQQNKRKIKNRINDLNQ